MSDTATSTTPSGVVPPPAPAAPTLTQADAALVAAELAKLLPAPAAGTVPPAAAPLTANPPSPVNLFAKGNIVEYVWEDHYDGRSSRVGIVVDVIADDGTGAKSIVAWFEHVSGPIGDHELTAV